MIPRHVGIIMDGNGRWAKSRGLIRTQGHQEGLKAAKRIVKAASVRGISYLTLYTFSTENWKRAAEEVGFIMGLVRQYLKSELDFCRENKIRVRHAGDKTTLPPDINKELEDTGEATCEFTGLQVVLALNYGGRDEIVRAVKKMIQNGGIVPGTITTEFLSQYLDNPDIPDPDLIIRTAGEFRTSNFLLWEAAYSEYYISDKLWPDWDEEDLDLAIETFNRRERRFGGIKGELPKAGA
ncbi:MAG: di-trans,poly-cis-decaprenylcistransferase [Treponema sp.]|jgi:undecaprenyl diphosphate synthase|nr:di-trans,poly-cis-decaprenylcistransferase [Treponema sp.]